MEISIKALPKELLTKTIMPMKLIIKGNRVRQLFQSYITPPAYMLAIALFTMKGLKLPHVKGIKNPVIEEINKIVPIQLMAFNFSITKPSLRFSLRDIGMVMNATRQKGIFCFLLAYTLSSSFASFGISIFTYKPKYPAPRRLRCKDTTNDRASNRPNCPL